MTPDSIQPSNAAKARSPNRTGSLEAPFWNGIGAAWRKLAGGMDDTGYSFEYHEWQAGPAVDWSNSFHPQSVEICLNLEGAGWVAAGSNRMEFQPETAGFFGCNGATLLAGRAAGQRHRFLSVEFSVEFLKHHLSAQAGELHALVRDCVRSQRGALGISGVSPINHRQRDLLRTLLHPPVLKAAQRLWYESKALEFAAEFLFVAEDEPLCTRAHRLAQERVAKAKALLSANLENPLSLEALGRQVGCSHFYLSRTFTQETGMTISQWLRRARLEFAAELLRSGSCNVTEASLRVGYSSLSHFSQAFHEIFGCCPGLYPVRTTTQSAPSRTTEL
jgi:AraC-like DNA-binding protein